jgi:hypothetical protein
VAQFPARPRKRLTVADAATRSGSFFRTATESLTVSEHATIPDKPVRVLPPLMATAWWFFRVAAPVTVRTATEAPVVADVATRTGSFGRTSAEAPTVADAATRAGSFSRTASETLTVADVATQVKTAVRTATETLSVAETLTRLFSGGRTAAEAPHSSDSAVRVSAAVRTAGETPTSSDAATRTAAFGRSASEAPVVADVATETKSKLVSATETLSVSTAATRAEVLSRTAAESPTVADVATKSLSAQRTATETPTVADIATATKSKLVSATETLSVATAAVRVVTFGRTAAETPTSGDAATRSLTAARATAESLSVVPPSVVSTANLVSYWKLDEASGSAIDAVGSETLTDNNTVTSAAGKVGGARQFTVGNAEYLSHADDANLSAGDIDFTFQAWVQLSGGLVADRVILAKTPAAGQGPREYYLRYSSTFNRFQLQVQGATGGVVVVTANNGGPVSAGVWYLVHAWHDSVNNLIGISVNAGTADTTAHSLGVSDGTGSFTIGKDGDFTGDYWNGLIDEVGFWKRVLTPTERTTLYNGGQGLGYPFTAEAVRTVTAVRSAAEVPSVATVAVRAYAPTRNVSEAVSVVRRADPPRDVRADGERVVDRGRRDGGRARVPAPQRRRRPGRRGGVARGRGGLHPGSRVVGGGPGSRVVRGGGRE